MFKPCPIIDTCKIKVKLEEETQEVDFEKPIKEIEYGSAVTRCKNCRQRNRKLFCGFLFGFGLSAFSFYAWMSMTGTTFCTHHYTPISIESAGRLMDQGISWNVEKRVWDVTEVSPIVQKVHR